MRTTEVQLLAYTIIMSFPKSKNGQPYLVLKNGKKLFFNRFIKKYGIDSTKSQYKNSDINRRVRLVEFFKYFTQEYELKPAREEEKNLLESQVIINTPVGNNKRATHKMELLSFYPL